MKSATLVLGEHKSTVNAVNPGLIDTPLTRHRQRYEQAIDNLESKESTTILEAEAKRKLIAKTPLGVSWIEPAAIARQLCSWRQPKPMWQVRTYDVTGEDSGNYTA